MAERVTLQTIADRLGVSRMTVSNAFSRPDQLSSALRQRILTVADELGYIGPDPAARALARGRSGAVGVLLTDSLHEAFADEFATAFLGAVLEELSATGLALTMLTVGEGVDVVPARDLALDGALIYSCRPTSTARQWLLKRALPLVFVDQAPVAGYPTVNVDDRRGARLAAEHLVQLGHTRVGILTRTAGTSTGWSDARAFVGEDAGEGHPQTQRMLGWLDALEPAGIVPATYQVAHGDDTRAAAHQLLDADERPTAVLCFADFVAFEVVAAAGERRLDVPGDLSVVGFDDTPSARTHRPPLTTVRQDVIAKGRAAGRALLVALADDADVDAVAASAVLLPTELVIRESTAPPR